ncbi:MAG: extracellular solute-binding protein [Clostridia bacterium]|nr:extracellular solute-binding protein [Clostridia bacterium]
MKKATAWLAALALLLGCLPHTFAEEGASAEWMMFASRTEPYYSDAAKTYTLPLYEGEGIEMPLSAALKTGEETEISFAVPQDGLYELWFTYYTETQSALPSEMTVTVDGEIPFYELRRVKLKGLWMDDGVFPLDRYGNEIATTPTAQRVLLESGIQDSAGWTDTPFLFELTQGQHTLGLQMQEGAVTLEGLSVRARESLPGYQGQAADGDALIVIEGERIHSRNKSSIRAAGEFDPNLTPYETRHRKMNFMDGASFNAAGDEVTWRFTAEQEGWYNLGFRYRQSVKADFPVFADVLIDGALPSAQARQVAFDYATSFSFGQAATNQGEAQTFYLTAGEHDLTLRLNGAALLPVYEVINRVLSEINGLSLEVVRLTGGVTTDRYRDYELLTYIPDLVEILNGWAEELDHTVDGMKAYSATRSGSAFSNLTLAADQLRRLALKPEDLPRRLSELSTGSNSAARMLAQQLQDIARNNLAIDEIIFYQDSAKLPQGSDFFNSAARNVERFITSFGSQDYAAGTGKAGHLQVWMGRSRQYLEIVQNMVDTMFTPETGIEVDLSIMPDANKLVLANAAGTAPDVVLSLQYVVPSYLNIRGALYDLTQFPDFPEIAQRFSSGLFIPYTLGDGIYAMPETVNFWVQFYRKDILDALNIEVPDSLEQVKMILPELQRRNMNYYFPTAGMSGMKVFPGTLPLILQSGGSIYGDTIGDTTLDSEESLRGFREMTELFTVYNMPTDVPSPGFYQQFRDGTLPIGIADLATYNLLLNAAPELDGMWDISLYPGLTDEEGNVLRWTTGGAETMAILSQTEMPGEAWTFLKWWSSAEVQSSFGNLLQSTYGSEYIWPTANREAFETLPLKSAHKKIILEQMEWMTEAPWVLGTYMLERELSNAFISVSVDGTDARRALDTAVKRINRETYRKLEEFGYWKDGVMLREFKTPDASVVQNLIDQYNRNKEAEE